MKKKYHNLLLLKVDTRDSIFALDRAKVKASLNEGIPIIPKTYRE
jgi:hypothetical protein